MTGAPLRVVVGEDSFLMRAGVVRMLETSGFAVVGEAGDAGELMHQVELTGPDVVVTDIRMPPTHTDEGLRAAVAIRARRTPGTGVLVLSQHVRQSYALQLLGENAAGVGYLLKERVTEPGTFAQALREVARGGSALDPEVVAQMLDRRRPGGPIDTLDSVEHEVLARVAEGLSNRAIAAELGVGEHALERHLTRVFAKLGLAADPEGHRRVLAVLTFLRAQED